jgi:formyltetrahydrofolate synthetase
VIRAARAAGAVDAVVSKHWAHGGAGAVALGRAVVRATEQPSDFRFLYPLDLPVREKIEIIAREVYGADGVEFEPLAGERIDLFTRQGFSDLPICMAKTPLSISHDSSMKGRPSGFTVPVREVRASVGAGFLVVLLGEIRTMPGLGARPAYMNVDIDEDGKIIGLF